MDKKTIDNIVWWIPFKKLRRSFRELLNFILNIDDKVNVIENKVNVIENKVNVIENKASLDVNNFKEYINESFTEYHFNILVNLNSEYGFKDKKILDVGGSNIPVEVMKAFGVKQFICLDPVSKWLNYHDEKINNQYYGKKVVKNDHLKDYIEDEFSFVLDTEIENFDNLILNEYFDIIISISTFEHVDSILITTNKIYSMLKFNGVFYCSYEPIFSSTGGHHVYISQDINFQVTDELKNFLHLMCTREEVKSFLMQYDTLKPNIDKILYQMFDSNIINRKFFNEHIQEIFNSKFNHYTINYFYIIPVDDQVLVKLCDKFGYMRYDVRGVKLTCIKQ